MRLLQLAMVCTVALLVGACVSATATKQIQYVTTPDRALECAMGAARDIGLKIESTDANTGTFSAVKIGTSTLNPKDMANYQASFAVDKQTKSVQVDVQSFGQLMPGDEIITTMIADFQTAFRKRCAISDSGAATKPQVAASPTSTTPPTQAAAQQAPLPTQDARPATGTSAARQSASQPSRDMIAKSQTRLNALGFDVGAPDGSMGPRTKNAITRFQTSKGLAASGDLTAETLNALGVSATQPAASAQPAAAAQPVKAGQL